MLKVIWEVIRYSLSPRLLVSLAYGYAYYIHEHVIWRSHIHAREGARIHATASIRYAHNVYVGKNSHINHLCCVWAGEKAKVILGDNVLMGPGVGIFAVNHGTVKGQPMMLQERTEATITIGDDVWIGADAFIGPGVRVGSLTVVGARSSAYKDLSAGQVYVGNPAKAIKERVLR